MRFLVTGSAGLVGRAMVATLESRGEPVSGFDHAALDISDPAAIDRVFKLAAPEVVINCAAWTDVDGCETNPERATAANARGPELLALACHEIGALFITISTDYVFDGAQPGFYTQRDQPNPLSVYGRSKLEGERRAQQAWARTIVVRSGYIFGSGGTNFLSTIIPRATRGEALKAISDMCGTPTFGVDLAARIYELARLDIPGLFHVVNAGEGGTFAEFARKAVETAGLTNVSVESVSLKSLNRPAPRPANSRLRCILSPALGLAPLPTWEDALQRFVTEQLERTAMP